MTDTPSQSPTRKIIHVDMDAFFASVEQRDNPELRGRPVAVGGARERGVVAAASYEARKFGIHSAMPSVRAQKLCPDLVFVKPRFEVYRDVSRQIRAIFAEHTPLIEPLSLDEAYMDVTVNLKGLPSATEVAIKIKEAIKRETGLTASAGVAVNKFLAKMASDYNKPDGLYVITPKMGSAFVENLDIGKFHGIGPATKVKMNEMGIHTGLDIRQRSLEELSGRFGKAGTYFYWIARGIDERPVNPNRIRKSIGAENTFSSDLTDFEELSIELYPLAEKVWQAAQKYDAHGKTTTLKVKFSDFHQITRSRTQGSTFMSSDEIRETAEFLLKDLFPLQIGIRLIGITLSGFDHVKGTGKGDDRQMNLFD